MVIQPHVTGGRIMADEFQKLTGAKVNVLPVPNDQIQQKATLDVQSGANVHDVIDYWYCLLGAGAEDGTVVDVTDRIAKDFVATDSMRRVPVEIDEAAKLDGAGYFTIISRVIAPIMAPGLLPRA